MSFELNTIWMVGKSAAINGYTIDDCPYRGGPRKRAWQLGFIAGLEVVRANNNP